MQSAPQNKPAKYPTATPAHADFERAVARLKDAEAEFGPQSPAAQLARARVTEADQAYDAAVKADERRG